MGCWGVGERQSLEEIMLNDKENIYLGFRFQVGYNRVRTSIGKYLCKTSVIPTTPIFAPLFLSQCIPLRAWQRIWSRFLDSLRGGSMIMIMLCKSETNWIMADLRGSEGLCCSLLLQIDWYSPGRILARNRARRNNIRYLTQGLYWKSNSSWKLSSQCSPILWSYKFSSWLLTNWDIIRCQ